MKNFQKKITVGLASCGISAGGEEVYQTFSKLIKKNPQKNIILEKTGCIGSCFQEVLVDVFDKNGKHTYAKVDSQKAQQIFKEDLLNNKIVIPFLLEKERTDPYFKSQQKIALRHCGLINPEKIEDYLKIGGYQALKKCLSLSSAKIITLIKKSELRGRGGGGFLTGLKWELTAKQKEKTKYVICNADEGDPGAFMDRSLLEGDPLAVIEGLTIVAYALKAQEGFIYVRAEYPLAIQRLERALQQAKEKNFLGENILGSTFSFNLSLKIGAGAFVCGEETALIASIEGKRGSPRIKPPFPAEQGLWGKPTLINNVETLANLPYIIEKGWSHFASIGTKNSKGTKVFALTGKIKNSGLVEVPMGITLRKIIFEIGGGIKNNKKFKAVQLGGPSGGCLPEKLLDTPVDYESLKKTGAIMGSGGMVIMDEENCMVDVAKFFMAFICEESCGKCTFCRIGTKRMYEILEKITSGQGKMSDLDLLINLAHQVTQGSLCGLGQTAANPILTTLKYFKNEYLEHIKEKKCRAKVCQTLLTYTIEKDKCVGCTLCAQNCPGEAIFGSRKEVHLIDQEKCLKCGQCLKVCKFGAIKVE